MVYGEYPVVQLFSDGIRDCTSPLAGRATTPERKEVEYELLTQHCDNRSIFHTFSTSGRSSGTKSEREQNSHPVSTESLGQYQGTMARTEVVVL
jgi:hypothetical protein